MKQIEAMPGRSADEIARAALTDIQALLSEGYDTNIWEYNTPGLKETIAELAGLVEDPQWLPRLRKSLYGA